MKTGGAVGKPFSRAVLAASVALAFSSASYAAGLGRLNVLSDLGQPLRAEIDVVAVEKGELDSLNAKLGTIDSYIQNNLPYPPPSLGLKLSLEKRASGTPYITATTTQPVNEPFVDILVELTWNGGRILRAYTALLDPPTYAGEQPAAAPVAPPVASAEPAPSKPAQAPAPAVETQLGSEFTKKPEPEVSEPATAEAGSEPAPAPAPATDGPAAAMPAEAGMPKAAPAAAAQGREHSVKRGDTLGKIAREYKTDDASLEQMLVLLFRNNPDAFAGKNMNRLKTGKVLQIPDAGEAAAIDAKEARKEVRLQTADFNAFKERLASAAGAAEPSTAGAGQSSGGAVSPMVTDKGAPAESQPKEVLKLSKGDGAAGGGGTAKLRALEEELAAREKTIKEQNERVAKLEKQVKDMQVLLELKSKGMADLQKQATTPATTMAQAGTTPPKEPVKEPAKDKAHDGKAGHDTPSATTPAATTTPPSATMPATTPSPAATAEAPHGAQSATAEAAPAKKPARPKVVEAPAPAATSILDEIMDPLYLGGGAAVVALLGFLGFRVAKKRKGGEFEDPEAAEKKNSDSIATPPAAPTATDGTGSMAAAARAVTAAAPVTEEVDPLAEAEIYLAYGRDAQAEEILKEALGTSPRRQEIQLKLLEIYAKRKDTGAFDPIARELQASTGGQGDLWVQAARLGYSIDPQNPRYAAGKGAGAEVPAALAAAAAPSVLDEKLDFNIGLDDSDTGTKTDIDLSRLGGGGGTSTDIDLSNLGATGGPEIDLSTISGVPEKTTPVDLDIGAAPDTVATPSGLDFDFDLNALGGGEAPAVENTQTVTKAMSQTVADVGEPGLGTIEFDLSKISLDSGGKQEPTLDVGGGVPELDLSGINLDLDSGTASASGATSTAARDDHWYDVQTKFDLAKAYQEMGDKEGAREILREVIQEGDGEQQAAAKRVLEALV
jgi:pilus assembly protein FimV